MRFSAFFPYENYAHWFKTQLKREIEFAHCSQRKEKIALLSGPPILLDGYSRIQLAIDYKQWKNRSQFEFHEQNLHLPSATASQTKAYCIIICNLKAIETEIGLAKDKLGRKTWLFPLLPYWPGILWSNLNNYCFLKD